LFPETLELKRQLEDKFGLPIESLHPEQTVEEQSGEHGEALWTRYPDLCCTMRKVIPLQSRGYRSIGCLPCTRPVGESDGERAGRCS